MGTAESHSGFSLRSAVVIMAKAPAAGRVKTRLSPPLRPDEAASLYALFVEDVAEEMAKLADPDGDAGFPCTVAIAYAPEGARTVLKALVPDDLPLFAQQGKDLGERMAFVFQRLFARSVDQVLIIGSDSPDLPCRCVVHAIERLRDPDTDVVIGPCRDGGYYLVGLKKPVPALFDHMPWGTGEVLETTLQRARALGLLPALLDPWEDIDTHDDLVRFLERNRKRAADDKGPGWRTLKHLRSRSGFFASFRAFRS